MRVVKQQEKQRDSAFKYSAGDGGGEEEEGGSVGEEGE
jgi:hypothetical protein